MPGAVGKSWRFLEPSLLDHVAQVVVEEEADLPRIQALAGPD